MKYAEKKIIISEIDKVLNIAWVCCPDYMEGDDKHDAYSVELTREIEEMFLKEVYYEEY